MQFWGSHPHQQCFGAEFLMRALEWTQFPSVMTGSNASMWGTMLKSTKRGGASERERESTVCSHSTGLKSWIAPTSISLSDCIVMDVRPGHAFRLFLGCLQLDPGLRHQESYLPKVTFDEVVYLPVFADALVQTMFRSKCRLMPLRRH